MAAGEIHLEFPDAGLRQAFFGAKPPITPPKSSMQSEEKGMDLSVAQAREADSVFVWDRKTNNVAARPLKNIEQSSWTVDAKWYKVIGEVVVKVQFEGKPVSAADITLSSGDWKASLLLDPSAKGEARFFGPPPGELKATVEYRKEDGGKDSTTVSQKVALERDSSEINMVVAIPSKVATLEEASTAASEGEPAKETEGTRTSGKDSPANPIGQFVSAVLVLGIVVGGGYAFLRYMKKDPTALKDQLTKLGVQIPDPNALPADDGPPPMTPSTPQPVAQIVLGPDANDFGSIDLSAPIATSLITGTPKIRRDDGTVIELAEGDTTVGREDGLPVSLSGESTVSRRHAVLSRSGDSVVVRDLGSTNGTFVNGMKVSAEVPLRAGDDVQFGSVRFRYEG